MSPCAILFTRILKNSTNSSMLRNTAYVVIKEKNLKLYLTHDIVVAVCKNRVLHPRLD